MDIPIWSDADVKRIYDLVDGRPWPRFVIFNDYPDQLALIRDFTEADQNAESDSPASAFVDACLAGIRAVEGLPESVDVGWIKFLVYQIDINNHFLWDLYHRSEEVAAIGEWTVNAIHRRGWGPDGNSSALGQRHSNAMALAAAAGGGLHVRSDTGKYEYGNGDAARRAALGGGFGSEGNVFREATSEPPSPSPVTSSSGEASPLAHVRDRIALAEDGDRASGQFLLGLRAAMEGDVETAVRCFEDAAQLGDVESMLEAGNIHVSKGNRGTAKFWFETAAKAGDAGAAMSAAGLAHEDGALGDAHHWYGRAVELGAINGYSGLARTADDAGNEVAAREWSRKGAELGVVDCMTLHAYFLLADSQVLMQEGSDEESRRVLGDCLSFAERAANQEEVAAMYSAGLASAALGRDQQGLSWLRQAEQAGHPNARAMIERFGLE